MRLVTGALAAAAVAVVAATAAIQAAVALGVTEIGTDPGEGAVGQVRGATIGVAALLVACGALMFLAAMGGDRRIAAVSLLAAALHVAASITAYDPYYAPTLRRPIDGPAWSVVAGTAVVIALAAVGVSAAGRRRGPVTAIAGIACALAAIVAVYAHLH